MSNIYVKSGAAGSADGTSWTNAYTTLQAALTAWTTADQIFVAHNHAEDSAVAITYTAPNANNANPVPIYRVNSGTDQYDPVNQSSPGSANLTTSTTNKDMTFNFDVCMFGLYITTTGDMRFNQSAKKYFLRDLVIEGDNLTISEANQNQAFQMINCFYRNMSTSVFSMSNGGMPVVEACKFSGTVAANGFIQNGSNRSCMLRLRGCDLSGITTTTPTLCDLPSAGTNFDIEFERCKMPTGYVVHTDAFVNDGQEIRLIACDTGGNAYVSRKYGYRGTVLEDASVYLSGGFQPEGASNPISRKLTSASNVKNHIPLRSLDILFYYDGATGSSKTFTVEMLENFTTALTDLNCWLELFYNGTASQILYSFANSRPSDIVSAGSALSAGVGTGSWTSPPSGSRSVKLSVTATPQVKGLYVARIALGAYESGKVVHYNPKITVT